MSRDEFRRVEVTLNNELGESEAGKSIVSGGNIVLPCSKNGTPRESKERIITITYCDEALSIQYEGLSTPGTRGVRMWRSRLAVECTDSGKGFNCQWSDAGPGSTE